MNNYVKNHLNYVEFCIHVLKADFSFYKNSTIQTVTFISSKVVYFKKHLTHQV